MKKMLKIMGFIFLGIVIIMISFIVIDLNKQKEVRKMTIKDIKINDLADGKYTGEYNYYRWANKVEVTIANHQITNIKFTSDQAANIPEVTNELINKVIEKQSLKVDTISGSTITVKAYLKSIENALDK